MDSPAKHFLFALFLMFALVSPFFVQNDFLHLKDLLQFSPFAGKYVLGDGEAYVNMFQNLSVKNLSFKDFLSLSMNFEGYIMLWAFILSKQALGIGLTIFFGGFIPLAIVGFVVYELIMLPDIDLGRIGVGKWIVAPVTCFFYKIMSRVWEDGMGHRRFMHSIFAFLACFFLNIVAAFFLAKTVFYYFNPGIEHAPSFFFLLFFLFYEGYLILYTVLYLAHILADTLTYTGVPIFYPIPLTVHGSVKPALIILCAIPAAFLAKPFIPNLQVDPLQVSFYSLYFALASVFASWIVLTPYRNFKDFLASRKKSGASAPLSRLRGRGSVDENYTFNIRGDDEFLKMFDASPVLTMKGLEHDIVLAERKGDMKTFKFYSRLYAMGVKMLKRDEYDTSLFETFMQEHGISWEAGASQAPQIEREVPKTEPRVEERMSRPEPVPGEGVPKPEPPAAPGSENTVKSETVQEVEQKVEEKCRTSFDDLVSLKVFEDVVGLREAKEEIVWKFLVPILYPEKAGGRKPGGGMLLYGPPGTGKTEIARVLEKVCEENGIKFIPASPRSINRPLNGMSEKQIAQLFSEARSAPNGAIIFIDEADALLGMRGLLDPNWSFNLISQFLQEMDGLNTRCERIFVIACTNKPWNVDPAVTRPGRLSKRVYIPPPNYSERKELFKLFLKDKKVGEIDFDRLAYLTSSEAGVYSGADIMQICDEARVLAEKRGSNSITMKDLEEAIEKTAPSIPPKLLDAYEEYEKEYSGKKPPTEAQASNKTMYG
jgi:transitional endoplasmic reticulum ATPase